MLPKNAKLIFRGIVGSQSYGLATETSDTDYKSIYIQSNEDILSNRYIPQVEINKDDVAYEIRRFLELVSTGNPNVLELLFLPERCIVETSPEYEYLKSIRQEFLSKECYNTYSGYARTQLNKSSSLNKKFNWEEKRIQRKDIFDFAKIVDRHDGRVLDFKQWLVERADSSDIFSLTKIDGMRDQYKVYPFGRTRYEDSNEPKTTEIAKSVIHKWEGLLYWNREAYSTHAKEYKEYKNWLQNRNEARVATNKQHGQSVDSKNILHLVRLIMTAQEIPIENTINVDRTKNRDYLLSIKRGEVDLKEIISEWTEKVAALKEQYENSNLKEKVEKEFTNNLEHELRNYKK